MRLALALLALLAGGTAQAADRRIPVDPDRPPWNAVAKVQTNTAQHCTGVLIASAVVLTAAHCVYNPLTRALLQPVSLHVLFGYRRDQYRWHRGVVHVAVGPGFDGTLRQAQPSDWALLGLAQAVPLPPLPIARDAVRSGTAVALAGYNQDRAQLLLADPLCHVLRVQRQSGGLAFVLHDCEATRGTSGAPLLMRLGDGWAVAAINIAAGPNVNLALAVPPLSAEPSAATLPR